MVNDPDFGPIELPPPPPREVLERTARETERRLRSRDHRFVEEGKVRGCLHCGARALRGRSDLTHREVKDGLVYEFHNLHGAKCGKCGAQFLENYEIMAIEDVVFPNFAPDYAAKVSNIGSGTVGTYWPKDVVRVMGLTPHTPASIQVLDRDTALIRFRRSNAKAKPPPKRRRG